MAQGGMTFIDHLADLRKRILIILPVFVVMLIASLAFVSRLYDYLVHPLTRLGYKPMVISPGEIVMVYLSISAVVAIGLTLPVGLFQIWRFVSPGLTPTERRYTLRLLPLTLLMFILGICFAWFVLFPMILHFLITLAAEKATVNIRLDAYFSFLTGICLPFGFIFELPIVVVFLTRIGLLTPKWLRKVRRYAYLVIVVLGVFISPPELISHLSVIVPMMALYELSILLSALVHRKVLRQKVDFANS